MNNLKNFSLVLLFLSTVSYQVAAQFQGLVVQTGYSSAFSKDKNITPDGQGHYGWTVGADARLLEGDLYFIMGGHYHSTNIKASASRNPFGKHDWGYIVGRFGMGFSIWQIAENLTLRSKVLACINFNVKVPPSGFEPGYEKINDSFAGVASGLGVTFGMFEFDFDYQYPLLGSYFEKPDSKMTIISLVGGVRF